MFDAAKLGKMELKVEELLKRKGMRMAELAAKLNVDQSNLTRSLEGNPTLSRLKEVASALDVSVRDLFSDGKPSIKDGLLRIGDRHFALVPVEMPEASYNYTRERFYTETYEFVLKCLGKKDRTSSFCGLYGGVCPFSLIYDGESRRLFFSFCPTGDGCDTWVYDTGAERVIKYGYTPELAADYIARNIINDIEEIGHN